jgi:hypothetical protein
MEKKSGIFKSKTEAAQIIAIFILVGVVIYIILVLSGPSVSVFYADIPTAMPSTSVP